MVRGNSRFISSVEHDILRVSAAKEWEYPEARIVLFEKNFSYPLYSLCR